MACDKKTHELAMELLEKWEKTGGAFNDEVSPFLTVLMWNPSHVLPKSSEEALRKALSDAIVEMATMRQKLREIIRDQSQLAAGG